jgi:hypothetical protein
MFCGFQVSDSSDCGLLSGDTVVLWVENVRDLRLTCCGCHLYENFWDVALVRDLLLTTIVSVVCEAIFHCSSSLHLQVM